MSELKHNPSFYGNDRSSLKFRMVQLLSRRRSLVPWPLTAEETPLLWWPKASYELVGRLNTLGRFDKAFSSTHSINLFIPVTETVEFTLLNIYSSQGMLCFTRAPGKYSTNTGFDLITKGEVAEKFNDWFQKARVIHAWNKITNEIFGHILAFSTSWGQLRKAFPEMYDLLADAGIGDSEHWKYGNSNTRIDVLLQHFKAQGHAGAHDKIPDDLKKEILARKGPMIEVLKQALSISSSMAGALDTSEFKQTWFV